MVQTPRNIRRLSTLLENFFCSLRWSRGRRYSLFERTSHDRSNLRYSWTRDTTLMSRYLLRLSQDLINRVPPIHCKQFNVNYELRCSKCSNCAKTKAYWPALATETFKRRFVKIVFENFDISTETLASEVQRNTAPTCASIHRSLPGHFVWTVEKI